MYERVNRDMPLEGLHWIFDHAETISDKSIDRIAALGGGIAVQHRMAYQGEYSTDWQLVLAFVTLTILPAVIMFVVAQKYLVAGLTAGAIKG